MKAIILRPATEGDEAFLFALYCDTREDEVAGWGLGQDQAEELMRMQFGARQRSFSFQYAAAAHSIVFYGGEAAGSMLVDKTGGAFHLVDIALLGKFRGGGIGRRLLAGLLAEAEEGGKSVRLHVEATSRAVRLYRRLGFVEVEDKGAYLLMEWTSPGAAKTKVRHAVQGDRMSDQLTQEQFREHMNSAFLIPVGPGQALELRLVECRDLGSSATQEQFSLIFAGPPSPLVQQQTCPMQHPEMGDLSIFLVPTRRDQDHIYYEAIFNYFKKQGE